MASVYREAINDTRLKAVTEDVYAWVFGKLNSGGLNRMRPSGRPRVRNRAAKRSPLAAHLTYSPAADAVLPGVRRLAPTSFIKSAVSLFLGPAVR
jgi:hypothetical protein